MAKKEICNVCQKKINGINSIPNIIEGSVLCSQCYEKLAPFKMSKNYSNYDELQDAQSACLNKASQLNYPHDVLESLNKHFKEKEKKVKMSLELNQYLMTTGSVLQGYEIKEYLGVITGQVVLGTGFLSGFEASIADLTGGESLSYTEKLDAARKEAQNRAIKKSIMLGGNALIGVDIEFSSFSNDMISVVVSGTSVKVEKVGKNDL